MDLTKEMKAILTEAVGYAQKNRYEYITPEMVLMFICDDLRFSTAFYCSGGDVGTLRADLEKYVTEYQEKTDSSPEISAGMNAVFSYAARSASNSSRQEVDISHVIHGMWQLDELYAVYFMQLQDIEEAELLSNMSQIEDGTINSRSEETHAENDTDSRSSVDTEFAVCLNDRISDAAPLIGRENELERTIQILCRMDKNNPLHIGEPGVGKTALTYGLVRRIADGNVPEPLKGSRVYAIDLGSLLAGTQYRGDFEKRFKKVLSDIGKEEKPIVYIDEIHNLTGAGAVGESSFDAANMLKSYLSDGHMRFIGATTFEEYKKYFEKAKSMVRRFQNVEIKEPSADECVRILEGLKERYESFHGVRYADGVLRYAVDMSMKYITERFLPDKAIDIIDEAGAYRKLNPSEDMLVDKDAVNEVLTKICRVPVETVETEELTGLEKLGDNLKAKIFGQDEAVDQVSNAVKFSKAGLLDDNKPLASLLFVGPTGVGKTEIAKQLAAELGLKLIRFDMSEYEEKHAVAKLIGSPAGYVGYEDGGLLTEEIRKNPSSVLLLDEIEKAHPDIYNILLQIMDYATLTDNQGRKADFRNTVVIMTSNAGANRIGKSTIGFENPNRDSTVVMEEVKRIFQPEFRNRLDRIVVFSGMDDDMAQKVITKKLGELSSLLAKKNITLRYDRKAADMIRKKGVTSEYGAREADRVIRNEIKPLFVDEMLFGSLKNGGSITLSADEDRFIVTTDEV